MLADACDVDITRNILDHPTWAPELNASQRVGWVNSMRMRGDRMVEDAPLHWIGVRSPTAQMRDREVLVNGFFIVR